MAMGDIRRDGNRRLGGRYCERKNLTLCFPKSHRMLPSVRKVLIRKEGKSQVMGPATRISNVDIPRPQRIVLNERPARLDVIAHQRRENLVGGDGVGDLDFQQAAHRRVHGGFP